MVPKILPERGLVGEVQVVGDLLDAHRGVFQQVLGFDHDVVVDPLDRRPAADPADERRQVFWGQVQLFGIESDGAVPGVVFGEHAHEFVEILFIAASGRTPERRVGLYAVFDDAAYLVGERPDHRAHDFRGVAVGAGDRTFRPYLIERSADPLPFLSVERDAGMFFHVEEKPGHQFDVYVDPPEELLFADQGEHHAVRRGFALYDGAGQIHEEGLFADRVVGDVRGERDRTLRTEYHGEGVEPRGVAEQVVARVVFHPYAGGDDAAVEQEVVRTVPVYFEQFGERNALNCLLVHFREPVFAQR